MAGVASKTAISLRSHYGSHRGPFESVDELRQVLGSERIDSEQFDSLTVFTHSPGSVESAATPAVKRALAWADQR